MRSCSRCQAQLSDNEWSSGRCPICASLLVEQEEDSFDGGQDTIASIPDLSQHADEDSEPDLSDSSEIDQTHVESDGEIDQTFVESPDDAVHDTGSSTWNAAVDSGAAVRAGRPGSEALSGDDDGDTIDLGPGGLAARPDDDSDDDLLRNSSGDSTWIPGGSDGREDDANAGLQTQVIDNDDDGLDGTVTLPASGIRPGDESDSSPTATIVIGGSSNPTDSVADAQDEAGDDPDGGGRTLVIPADGSAPYPRPDESDGSDSTWIPDESGNEQASPDATIVVAADTGAGSGGAIDQTLVTSAGRGGDIDQTFVADDVPSDVLKTMNENWAGNVDAASRPGMTITNRQVISSHPRETLVIKQRTLRSREQLDPINDEYELIDKLGEGGMGVVYHARQTSINRDVAIKMLKPKISRSRDQREKFLAEAVVTGDLDHPNIVPIYDVASNDEGALFYSMKKVQGTPWMKVIGEKSQHENIEILMRVADAVAFAHDRGVVHRDLKPENVMLGEFGEILVMDWGLAQPTQHFRKGASIAQTNSMGGTPAYMAPEMATGPIERITHLSDIYLLGAMLYEIVTGHPPHTGQNAMKCLMAAARNKIVPTDKKGELVEIALKSLHTEPEQRYQSVKEFQQAIRDYLSHSESILLAERAREDLDVARGSGQYDDFARALYGYQEAFELWAGNTVAREGVSTVRLNYADAAFGKGDLDLGLSLLEADNPDHAPLRQKIEAAQHEREERQRRLKLYRRVGAAFVAVFLATVSVLSVVIYFFYTEAEESAIAAQQAADKAIEEEGKAREAETQAKENERRAETERIKAIASRNAESYGAYIARIGLANALIEENSFLNANAILDSCIPTDASQVDFRGWEWGRLKFLCQLESEDVRLDDSLNAVAVDRSSDRIAVAGESGLILVGPMSGLQDAESRQQLDVGRVRVNALSFSQDGTLLAAATAGAPGRADSKYIHVWRMPDGQPVARFRGHDDEVLSVEFSSDGRWLLTASRDARARLWDVSELVAGGETEPRFLEEFAEHTWWVWSARFSPDNRWIVTASQDETVLVWPVQSARGQDGTRTATREANQLIEALTGESQRRGSDTQAKQWTVAPFTGHRGPVLTAEFLGSVDGTPNRSDRPPLVVSAGYDRRLLIWDPQQVKPFDYQNILSETAQPIVPAAEFRELVGHRGTIRSLRVDSSGRYVISAADDNTVRYWDAVSEQLVTTFRGHNSWVLDAEIAVGDRELISVSHDQTVKRWSIDNYEEIRELTGRRFDRHSNSILSARFSRDGSEIVTASEDRTALTWDPGAARVRKELRVGHEFLASRAVFNPASRTLVTAAADSSIRGWSIETGAEEWSLEEAGRSGAFALSSDGSRLVCGSSAADDKGQWHLRLWNVSDLQRADAEPIQTVAPHRSEITALSFSQDGRLVVSGDLTGHVQLWNLETNAVTPLVGHSGRLVEFAFLPGDRYLLSASLDHSVGFWDLQTGREITDRVLKHDDRVLSLCLSSDGQRAVTSCADGQVRVWNTSNSRILRTLSPRGSWGSVSQRARSILRGRFAPSALQPAIEGRPNPRFTELAEQLQLDVAELTNLMQQTAAPSAEQQADLIKRLAAGLEVSQDWLQAPDISSVALSPDAQTVITVNPADGLVEFWNVADGQRQRTMAASDVGGLLWELVTVDAERFVTLGGTEGRLWRLSDGDHAKGYAELMRFSPQAVVTAADYSFDGRRIVTASYDAAARIWDADSGQLIRTLFRSEDGLINSVVFSPDAGSRYVLTGSQRGRVVLWNATDADVIHTFDASREVKQVAFSPDGSRIAAACAGGLILIWSADDYRETGRLLHDDSSPLWCLAWSSDGKRMATGSENANAYLWDVEQRELLLTLEGHTAAIRSIAFSPDDQRIVTGSDDYFLKIWDPRRNDRLQEMNQSLISQGGESSTSLDEPAAGSDADMSKTIQAILSLAGHTREVTSVMFSPDGHSILSASRDGIAIVWQTYTP